MSTGPTPPVVPPPAPVDSEAFDERWRKREFLLTAISTVGLILGGIWGLIQYFQKHAEEQAQREDIATRDRRQREELATAEQAQRERELRHTIYREKQEAYGVFLSAAANVATAKDRAEVRERSRAFYAVYFTRVHIIPPSSGVDTAKQDFKKVLDEYLKGDNAVDPLETFQGPLFLLTKAVQVDLDRARLDPNP